MKRLLFLFILVTLFACSQSKEQAATVDVAQIYNLAWSDGFLRGRENTTGRWKEQRAIDSLKFITKWKAQTNN